MYRLRPQHTGFTIPTTFMAKRMRRYSPDQFEPPLDRQVAEKGSKGPKSAHPLPVYKPMHKLHNSARWKSANKVVGKIEQYSKDNNVAQQHSEGRVDVTGHYRDWVYGADRRFANYMALTLGCISGGCFFYTISSLRSDTWEIPAPLVMQPPPVASKAQNLMEGKAAHIPLLDAPSMARR